MPVKYNEIETIKVDRNLKVTLYQSEIVGRYAFHVCEGDVPLMSLNIVEARKLSEVLTQLLTKTQMSNNPRNTQFQDFAKALWQEIAFTHDDNVQRDVAYNIKVIEELIARRAYDLAAHVVENVSAYSVPSIPDMTELPKEQDYGNGNSVVHPVPHIEVWNALVTRVKKIDSDHPYIDTAMNVLSEMRKYVGYNYAVGFQVPVDVVRLAIAIERFVEKPKEQEYE